MTKKKWDALRAKKTFEANSNDNNNNGEESSFFPDKYEPPSKMMRKEKEMPQSKIVEYECEDEEKSKFIPKPCHRQESSDEEEEEKTSQELKLD